MLLKWGFFAWMMPIFFRICVLKTFPFVYLFIPKKMLKPSRRSYLWLFPCNFQLQFWPKKPHPFFFYYLNYQRLLKLFILYDKFVFLWIYNEKIHLFWVWKNSIMDHAHYQGQKILKDIDRKFNKGLSINNFCHKLQILHVKQMPPSPLKHTNTCALLLLTDNRQDKTFKLKGL